MSLYIDGVQFIRAVQGHSMNEVDENELLTRLHPEDRDLPRLCVHGTYRRYVQSILAKGLKAGGTKKGFRNHVHFQPCEPGDKRVISGMRYGCEVAIYLDLKRAIEDGIPFYSAVNEVILTPGINGVVSAEYIDRIDDIYQKSVPYEK